MNSILCLVHSVEIYFYTNIDIFRTLLNTVKPVYNLQS